MVQVPILNGIFMDTSPDFRIQYPINMVPVILNTGISEGYIRPSDGIELFVDTEYGVDRGGILWDSTLYRVQGEYLVSIDSSGVVTNIGYVSNAANLPCALDYSFTYLIILSDNRYFLWNGITLSEPLPLNLGIPIDMLFLNGYIVFTDGENIYTTDINNPLIISSDKYGSSELDPDPVLALEKLRNQLYALNRYTIEVFNVVGGSGFPFQRINGAQINKGVIGTDACCTIEVGKGEFIAFMGGGKNEDIGIHIGAKAFSFKISTRTIDMILSEYNEQQLSLSVLESIIIKERSLLYVHLSDQTLVYDATASESSGSKIWYILKSSLGYILSSEISSLSRYRARNFVKAYDKWTCGDPTTSKVGILSDKISSHYGDKVGWMFSTLVIYNSSKGALFKRLELEALTGSVELGSNPKIFTDYSFDGISWSNPRSKNIGTKGDRDKRIVWFSQGKMRKRRIQRFYGTSDAHLSIARLEAEFKGLTH